MPSEDKCQPLRDLLKDIREVKDTLKAGLHKLATLEMKVQMQLEECENKPPAGT